MSDECGVSFDQAYVTANHLKIGSLAILQSPENPSAGPGLDIQLVPAARVAPETLLQCLTRPLKSSYGVAALLARPIPCMFL